MKILTDQSFNEAIKMCKENDKYRVLIVTQYADNHHFLLDRLPAQDAEIVRCYGHPWAKFPNGSVIQIISIASNTRGRIADLVLCQAEVYNSCEEARYVLQAIETKSMAFELCKGRIEKDD